MVDHEVLSIPGLPEGIVPIGFRATEDSDIVFHDGVIAPGRRGYIDLVVVPAEGYSLTYDASIDQFYVDIIFPSAKSIDVRYEVRSKREEDIVNTAVGRLRQYIEDARIHGKTR